MPTLTCFPFSTSKVVSLHFARHGRVLYTAGMDGIICELNSRTGESKDTIKATKKPINSFTLSHDEKFMGVSSKITRLFSVSEKKEILRIPSDVVCHYLKLALLSPC
jgi:WD40 repeat protein